MLIKPRTVKMPVTINSTQFLSPEQRKVKYYIDETDKIARNSSTMEKLLKSLSGIFAVFDLPFTPSAPLVVAGLAKDTKGFCNIVGAIKPIFRFREWMKVDDFGRSPWETKSVLDLTGLTLHTAGNILGTIKYVCGLAAITFPTYISVARTFMLMGSYSIRAKQEKEKVDQMKVKLVRDECKIKLWNDKNINNKDILVKYVGKIEQGTQHLEKWHESFDRVVSEAPLQDFCQERIEKWQGRLSDPNKEEKAKLHLERWEKISQRLQSSQDDLQVRRSLAAKYGIKINLLQKKMNRWEQYKPKLESGSISEFRDLKILKWNNRKEDHTIDHKNGNIAVAFNVSMAALLALVGIATVFAITNVAMLTATVAVGLLVSFTGFRYTLFTLDKKKFSII